MIVLYGLVIKKEWLDLIIAGKKTIEVRGSRTSHLNETIYLCESGTHKVRDTCKIVDCKEVTPLSWYQEYSKHLVNISLNSLKDRYKKPHFWLLSKVKPIKEEIYYKHPNGAVIWVKGIEDLLIYV